jgi:TetR/AcrR family transcriptional regulator, mexJK operon transcriptional repressor
MAPESEAQPTIERPRRARRLASGGAIREAAIALFLEKGYQGTSMDEIAAAARVSKQTIYTHFANKEELFADLVLGNVERVDEMTGALSATVRGAADLDSGLRRLARLYIRAVVQPEVLRLRRLVLGEAGRFPDLARSYYERVPQRVYRTLAALFGELRDEGRLRLDDPELAAHHFAWLVIGLPLDEGMFIDSLPPKPAELDRQADAAVTVFLAAYRSA